jgi:hypothetical protein
MIIGLANQIKVAPISLLIELECPFSLSNIKFAIAPISVSIPRSPINKTIKELLQSFVQ